MGAAGRTGLTIVGQVVGSYFGPIGAAVGGALGATLGGALWPEQIEGPRLEGLQISSSSYGWPIPEVYGTVRTSGNIVWRYPLDSYYETSTTEDAGKGGGAEVTTYTYSLDFAMLICEGPIVGVRRVWADQKLIFDVSATETSTGPDGASAQLGVGVTQLIASGGGAASEMRVYLGTETQLPDPTIEAHVGVGSTPAYRGYCYLVFPNFNLTDFGNRIPNITVEVVKGGAAVGPRKLSEQVWSLPYESSVLVGGIDYSAHVRLVAADGVLTATPARSGYYTDSFVSDLDGSAVRVKPSSLLAWPDQMVDITGHNTLLLWDGSNAIYCMRLPSSNTAPEVLNFSVVAGVLDDVDLRTYLATGTDYSSILSDGWNYVHALIPCADARHVLSVLQPDAVPSDDGYWVLFRYEGGTFVEVDRGTVNPGDLSSIVRCSGTMRSINGGVSVYYCGILESDLLHAWLGGADYCTLFEIDGAGVLREVVALPQHVSANGFGTTTIYADNGMAWFEVDGYIHSMTRIEALPLSQPTLASVVSSICTASGLDTADIDVTDLAGTTVRGYLRPSRMAARAAIEPLMTAYAFDAVESDLKIKFRRRSATVDVTVPADDLGAGDEGSTEPAVESRRAQESELPQSIDLSYMDADADYQVGTQIAQRLAVTSEDRQSVRLAIALQAWQAAEIVHRMLFEAWVARNTRTFKTTLRYAKYEPTDVMTVEAADGATYTVRAIDKRERGQMIEWTGLDVDAAGFTPGATAAVSPGGGTLLGVPGPTDFFAGDLPPLREADFGTFGYYVAGNGYGAAAWSGAVVYESVDGTTYDAVGSISTGASIGWTTEALGRWGSTIGADEVFGGYLVDRINSVEVALTKGTLASCTYDELLEWTNVALIGDELVAFQTATLVATGVYRISGLLRGLQGTEQIAAAGHVSGERFVLLTEASAVRVSGSYADAVGGDVFAKAVTSGRTIERSTAQTLERTGASAVPPAPTHCAGWKSGSDLLVNFTRRSYVDGTWDNGRDVPALATEEYAIDVHLASGSRKTFLRTGPAPHTITAAELATVGGAVSGVAFYVAQVPPATPGSMALLGIPSSRPAFWSRRTSVTWA